MADAARSLFDSLTDFPRLQDLVDNGEAEGLHLECKSPGAPQLTRDLRAKLAEAVSGFANTGGGVIIWGISTTKHAHSGLDLLAHIEPVGNCRNFAQQIDRAVPTTTYPSVNSLPSKIIHASKGDTRGVLVTYVPPTSGDPVQSLIDRRFYFRNGDEFAEMPYEMLKRMFAGVLAPDLVPIFHAALVEVDHNGQWKVPIILQNQSSAVAEVTKVVVDVSNPEACHEITAERFVDVSGVNPGRKMFICDVNGPIFRGLNVVVGILRVSMKRGKRFRRVLNLRIEVFSSKMRARRWQMRVQLAKKGFSVRETGSEDLYL